jgi:NAD(P)-dependent dehydrogenase (short-subunit alcohol dehydrogenase family)
MQYGALPAGATSTEGTQMKVLDGRRTLVVGASRGIGRGIAEACAQAGARVAVAARSVDVLEEYAGDLGATVVECDVRADASARRAVDQAAGALGGLDAVVYATGITAFGDVAEYSRDTLLDVFATNLFGAHSVASAAVPYLEAAAGHAIFLNSESALTEPDPWPGIAAYISSKRALESMVRSFRVEHPMVAFTNYFVGSTLSEINNVGVEPFLPGWIERQLVPVTNILLPEDHGQAVVDLLGVGHRVLIDAVNVRTRHLAPPANRQES